MLKAMDALWDAIGSKDPTDAATTAWHTRSPTPAQGKKGDKRGGDALSKSRPSTPSAFLQIQKPQQWHG
jgi:hypothetical protein